MSAIDDVLASVKSSRASVDGNRIVLCGVTTLAITCENASAFRAREDLGNVPNGQTQVLPNPARWGRIGGPPDTYEEMMSSSDAGLPAN